VAISSFSFRIDIGFQNQLNKAKEGLKEAAGVMIFLKEAANNSQIQALIKEIEAVDGVREVKFISKEEALRTFQKRNKDNPELLEKASKEALPDSIAVFLDDLSLKNQIEALSKSKPFVDKVVKPID